MTCLRFLVSKGKLWLGGENPTVKQVWLSDEVPGLCLTEDSLKPGDCLVEENPLFCQCCVGIALRGGSNCWGFNSWG